MKTTTLLIIEVKHAEIPSFASDLQKKGFDVHIAQNGSKAVTLLKEVSPSLVVINAASLRSTGLRICQSIREKDAKLPIILILEDEKEVNKDAADAVLALPFTVQKLVNRIKPLLPGDGKNVLHVGPIRLDLEKRRVRCLGKSTKLTPRLVTLLHLLMDKHGEVVEREQQVDRDEDYKHGVHDGMSSVSLRSSRWMLGDCRCRRAQSMIVGGRPAAFQASSMPPGLWR